ncbi:MAG: hypothetical protein JSS32_05660 [Verrucomicrobia bacterium]|nr:hypothetical protein [Verrucomicrobiota bacterium]
MNPVSQQTAVTFSSDAMDRPYRGHCPLCVDSMVLPPEDNRPPVLVFIDMDNVFIADRSSIPLADQIVQTASRLFPDMKVRTDYQWTIAKAKHLDLGSLKNFDTLIERIEASGRRALIVLSSSWRNDATLQQLREEVFAEYKFSKYLCGKTAPEYSETWAPERKQGFDFDQVARDSYKIELQGTAAVIEFWLRDHGFDPSSAKYLVLDDQLNSALESLGNRFIRTDGYFRESDLEKATKTLIDE